MLHRIGNQRSASLKKKPGAGRGRRGSPGLEQLEARALLASISDLGPFSTIWGAGVTGINTTADVAGTGGSLDTLEAFYLDHNGVNHPIAPLPGYSESLATGVNDLSEVVGYSQKTGSSLSAQEAFLYSQGTVTDLGTLGGKNSEANAISSNSGLVVGSAGTSSGATHAFLYKNGKMTDLETLGGNTSDATGINDVGQIVGYSKVGTSGSSATHAFLDSNGTMTDLGVPAGYDDSYANAINTYGQIVGYATRGSFPSQVEEAFMYSQGQWIDLGTLGGTTSVATGIDDEGQVVGYSTTTTHIDPPEDAFLYTSAGGLQDLKTIVGIGSGWTLQTATAINANGAILGIGTTDNYAHGYILYPPFGPPQDPKSGGATTTTLQVGSSSVYGQAVTLSAMVHPGSGATGFPTGTVTFADGTKTLGSAPVRNGIATITVDTLSIGAHAITAAYSGDPQYGQSDSAAVKAAVQPDGTTVSVVSLSDPSRIGQPVTFAVQVSAMAPGGGKPAGTVTFFDGSTTLGTATVSGGLATFTTSALSLGGHSIKVVYGGSTEYLGGTSAPMPQSVESMGFGTVTKLTAKVRTSKWGRSITLAARVKTAGAAKGGATGSVRFMDGATEIGTAFLHNGRATIRLANLPVGSHPIQVIYDGDGNDAPSTSAPLVETVVAGRSKVARGHRARSRVHP